ncbi:MAG: NAD(P)/FAD-dependent oxidoreductase [Actinobacteria bacterium]|nr:NAD(P)/FAD-dependent oxidoreductase [Actinomycetota bacterium]
MVLSPSIGPEREPPPPLAASDAEIDAAVAAADVPPLLTALAHLTGDLALLAEDTRPDQERLVEADAGLAPEEQATARTRAAAALRRYRDGGSQAAPTPDHKALRQMIEYLVGPEAVDDYLPLLAEELALEGSDVRAPGWSAAALAPGRTLRVAVIGAGMSGLAAAHRLRQAGVEVVVLEKNADVGGTWFENTYPGCRVDVPNHLYSYSFAQTGDWPQHFSTQDVLLEYFRRCADDLDLRPLIRFGTEVLGADFDDAAASWTVRTRSAAGEETLRVDAVVSAVGQLNRPSFPDIPGRDRFRGPSFHSARWDHDVDLDGRRVAVIGTGASAAQFVPAIAPLAGHLTVFQRTPPWLIPTPNYHAEVPDALRHLMHHVPDYARWDRLWLFWRTHEGLLPFARVDPDWSPKDRSVSALNDAVRELLTAYLRAELPDDDLFAKVLPAYPPIAKRVVRDNGIWARTLTRDDVELVTTSIERITETGVRTADGIDHDVDVIIYGTGFAASRFLTPMRVRGRAGRDLHDTWAGDARAHLGITVPGFPNLFLLYGPNTNIVINGSIIYFSECEVHYVVEAMRLLLEGGHRAIEVREDVYEAYGEMVDAGNRAMAWGASSVPSWYKNERGRVSQNWPFSLHEYWRRTRAPDPDEHVFH